MKSIIVLFLSLVITVAYSGRAYAPDVHTLQDFPQFKAADPDDWRAKYENAVKRAKQAVEIDNFMLLRSWTDNIFRQVERSLLVSNNFKDYDFEYLDENSPSFYLCQIMKIGKSAFETGLVERALKNLKVEIDERKIYSDEAISRIEAADVFAGQFEEAIYHFIESENLRYCGIDETQTGIMLVNIIKVRKSLDDLLADTDDLARDPKRVKIIGRQ